MHNRISDLLIQHGVRAGLNEAVQGAIPVHDERRGCVRTKGRR
jgi:hypothetical protein